MSIAPQRTISSDEVITGLYQGTIIVINDAELSINGTVQGTLSVESGRVIINGIQQGTVNLASGSSLVNKGSLQGTVNIENDAIFENAKEAKLAGSINVSGVLNNFGVRGGIVTGFGEVSDKPGSEVKQPTIINGISVYNW